MRRAAVALAVLGLAGCGHGDKTDAQRELLRRMGCPRGQGYLFGRPVPADELLPLAAAA